MASALDEGEYDLHNLKVLRKCMLFSYTWKVCNFALLPCAGKEDDYIQSPEFEFNHRNEGDSGSSTKKTLWMMKIFPGGFTNENTSTKNVGVYIYLKNAEPDENILQHTLLVINSVSDYTKYFKFDSINYKSDAQYWGFASVSRNELLKCKEFYLSNDSLTVTVTFFSKPVKDLIQKKLPNIRNDTCHIVTKHEIKTCAWVWKISQVRYWTNYGDCDIDIPSTGTASTENCIDNCSFGLSFCVAEDSTETDYAEIDISSRDNACGISIAGQVKVLSSSEVLSKKDSHVFAPEDDESWEFAPFIKVGDLQPGKLLTTEGELVLKFDFRYLILGAELHRTRYEKFSTRKCAFDNFDMSYLSCQLKRLSRNKQLTDVKLVCNDESFPVHKFVLMVRSPVFRAMFENPTKEKIEESVDITCVEANTMKHFIHYLYTDTLNKNKMTVRVILELYKAANYYLVDSLKTICSIFLLEHLSDDNFCDILELANSHDDNSLKDSLMDYLKNQSKDVFGSAKWRTYVSENPQLAADIMLCVLTNS